MLRIVPHAGPCLIFHHIILRKAAGVHCAPLQVAYHHNPLTSLKTRLFPHHHIPGPSRLSHLHTKTVPYPIKSGVQHRFFLSYSINSIIMLCAFCACSPIRQALSPAQNRSLPSPQSGQTNRPHKQSAGFSGQAGQCPGALSRSSA